MSFCFIILFFRKFASSIQHIYNMNARISIVHPRCRTFATCGFRSKIFYFGTRNIRTTLVMFILTFSSATMLNAQNIAGSWGGNLEVMGKKLPIVLNIEKSSASLVTKMDSPDQGAMGLPTKSTTFKSDTLYIDASNIGMAYKGALMGDSISGNFMQNGFKIPLVLRKVEKPVMNRPQTPKAPFPYIVEEITFPNKKDKINLSATLTMPKDCKNPPVVILIAGSGPNDRNEEVFGHKPFHVLADYLTRNGIAVLRYDKRGVGKSQGDFKKALIMDFAADVNSAIDYLLTRKDIDKTKIGLIGHSEGGMIAPMVASASKKVSYAVLMAAPGLKGTDIIYKQFIDGMKEGGMDDESINRVAPHLREMIAAANYDKTQKTQSVLADAVGRVWENMPILFKLSNKKDMYVRNQSKALIDDWYRSFLNSEPSVYLKKMNIPVLAINGEKDTQIFAEENLSAIEKALLSGNNKNVTIKRYPELNHLFQHAKTGQVPEYAQIEETISPEVLSDITEWILQQTKNN